MKKKYGEITMLDFPQYTKDTFPGVRHMDLWSSLFGDFDDASMLKEIVYTRLGGSWAERIFHWPECQAICRVQQHVAICIS